MGKKVLRLALLCILFSAAPVSRSRSASNPLGLPKALVLLNAKYGGAFIVDKSTATLEVYAHGSNGLELAKTYPIVTGKSHGNKVFQGDNRTPEGIYYFSEFKPQTQLLPKYGVGAFVMDYPNPFDLLLGKNGSGIWLHGTDAENRISTRFDSEGCVVVANAALAELDSYVRLQSSPIIVYNEVPRILESDRQKVEAQFRSFVEKWRSSWEEKRLDDYMSLYSKKNFSSRGMNWDAYRAYKNVLNKQYDKITIQVDDLRFFYFHPYAYVDLVQHYGSSGVNDSGNKRLALRLEAGEWKIVSEVFFKEMPAPQSRNISATTFVPNAKAQ